MTDTATFPMLIPARPMRHGQHRARRRYLQRRRPLWRDALAAIRDAVLGSPEATSWVVAATALVGMAIGASS